MCGAYVAGTRIGAVCVHLENRTTPTLRAKQTEAILEKAAEMFPGLPVLIGGRSVTIMNTAKKQKKAQQGESR